MFSNWFNDMLYWTLRSTSKLLVPSLIALGISPAFANESCPSGSYETLLESTGLSDTGRSGKYHYARTITFQGQEYDCLNFIKHIDPRTLLPYGPVEGKCGPFYAFVGGEITFISMIAKDGSYHTFDRTFRQTDREKKVVKCNSNMSLCNSYYIQETDIFKNPIIHNNIALKNIFVKQYKCGTPPTF